ncbi:uncharacterized protein ACA1_266810 [Acanthamoeba castellanii str. Neff]|uniref:Serine/threonine-protein kinase RIO1 n=1 Tax=Acanthamoeba castellanii (strain ATCC 30010 / Neff) TaxID=1257118 RepID=L8H1N7_ACACF|nr:uncharacterized protein ACA1_266810 [Acanthamoeba castellanii str. Neff]ELR19424.1 hypothetical protein ACA1_266810 [Acanthamoeba castellanii str. Neff]
MADIEDARFDDAEEEEKVEQSRSTGVVTVPNGDAAANHTNEVVGEDGEYEEGEEYYDDEEEDEDDDDDEDYYDFGMRAGNKDFAATANRAYQPTDTIIAQKLNNRMHLEDLHGSMDVRKMPNSVSSVIKESDKKDASQRMRVREKKDRATSEQVLDPRTRLILYKMLNREVIMEINGCISTGKEANVYHAVGKESEQLAVKVYKTSILVFKDRDRYVTGEFRFRKGYAKHNPRKMVRLWAEKEYRNLTRLVQAGINCPTPLALRMHVLVMTFLGKDGWPAPKMKEAVLSTNKWRELYVQCIRMMRTMYQQCRLVHGDLSEYNILYALPLCCAAHAGTHPVSRVWYYKGELYFIDVSQSVEHDHPHALDFLRLDCNNITLWFSKHGVPAMTTRELFEFVTDPTINQSNMDSYLEKMMATVERRMEEGMTNEEEIAEEVFKRSFIPRTLDDVIDAERDIFEKKGSGAVSDMHYQGVTGMRQDLSGASTVPSILEGDQTPTTTEPATDSTAVSGSDTEDGDSEEEGEGEGEEGTEGGELSKKERKKLVKEAQREKRKNKIPKKVKKRKQKQAKQGKKK